jgi:hypothetical protein
MKPGDRVIWVHSDGRSFLAGWRVQRIPGVVERIYRSRMRIRVTLRGREKAVNVLPENIITEPEPND